MLWLKLSLVPLLSREKDEISGGQVLDRAGKLLSRAVTGARRIHKPGAVTCSVALGQPPGS